MAIATCPFLEYNMRRILIVLSAILFVACNTNSNLGSEDNANTDDNKPQRPEDALSTLTEDLQVSFSEATSLIYADCFGDYYGTGLDMWQFYFMEFESKEQLRIEVMVRPNDLVVPTGTFTATSNIFHENGMLRGIIEEGYDTYSWYTKLGAGGKPIARAPIAEGSVTITANDDGTHTAIFNLQDDAYNKITGSCTATFIVEDFR